VTKPSHHDNYTSDAENVNHEGKGQSSSHPENVVSSPQFVQLHREWRKIEGSGEKSK